jgi:hypothetical protein
VESCGEGKTNQCRVRGSSCLAACGTETYDHTHQERPHTAKECPVCGVKPGEDCCWSREDTNESSLWGMERRPHADRNSAAADFTEPKKASKPLKVYRASGNWRDKRVKNLHEQANFVCAAPSEAAFLRDFPLLRLAQITEERRDNVKEMARLNPGTLFALGLTDLDGTFTEVTDPGSFSQPQPGRPQNKSRISVLFSDP